MSLKKQDFYEGAALYVLARSGLINGLGYQAPFFTVNGELSVLLKYSTKPRSPWGFTFMPDEQRRAHRKASEANLIIGLICAGDGIAAISYSELSEIAKMRDTGIRIGCARNHGGHYEVTGPDGRLGQRIAPARWHNLFLHGGIK